MTPVPIADELISSLSESPRLLASRCERCGAYSFPVQPGCARCGSEDLEAVELSPTGTLWTWTSQDFLPKSPPYAGPETDDTFRPWHVGYVELEEGICVEARLVGFEGRAPRIGEQMELVIVPFRTDESGNEVMVPAFAPKDLALEDGDA